MKNASFIFFATLLPSILLLSCDKGLLIPEWQEENVKVELRYLTRPPTGLYPVNQPRFWGIKGEDGCLDFPCGRVIAELRPYYQKIANETGEDQFFCVECCQKGMLVSALVIVSPNNIPESELQEGS